MANLYPAHDAQTWASATWSVADDDAQDHAAPTSGDVAIFTANSGTITLGADGDCGGLTMGGGVLVPAGYTLDAYGNVTYVAGTASGLTLACKANLNLSWNKYNQQLAIVVDPGIDVACVANVYCLSASLAGATISGAGTLLIYKPDVDDFLTTDVSTTWTVGHLQIMLPAGVATLTLNNDQWLGGGDVTVRNDGGGGTTRKLVFGGDVDFGSTPLVLHNYDAASTCVVEFNGDVANADFSALINDADGHGQLWLGAGTHDITDIAITAASTFTFAHETSTINLSGTYDGTGITPTNTSGLIAGGATVQDVDASGTNPLFAWGQTDGGSNVNVLFKPPGGGGPLEIGKPGVRVPGLNVGAAA